jgi:hypothetical protein
MVIFAQQTVNAPLGSAMEMFAPYKADLEVAAVAPLGALPATVVRKDFACLQTVLDSAGTETHVINRISVLQATHALGLCAPSQLARTESQQTLAPTATLEEADTREIALPDTGVHSKPEFLISATNSELRMALTAIQR